MLTPLWQPSEAYKNASMMMKFQDFVETKFGLSFSTYDELWKWSTENLADFWEAVAIYFNVSFHEFHSSVMEKPASGIMGTEWFKGSTLNYAEHIFRNCCDDRPAMIFQSETQEMIEISWKEMRRKTLAVQQFLLKEGIKKGDRIAGYLTNSPEAIYIFLAVNSLGAVWSCCSPDFGTSSVIERFQQIEPKILFATKAYSYNGKTFDKSKVINELSDNLPTVEETVVVGSLRWKSMLANVNTRKEMHFEPVAFDHPIWILYSSGTTGKPKAITHGTGGILLEHFKALALHQNVQPNDRFFWYSTTGWMMWNYALSSLLCGATLCLHDGSTAFPDNNVLWNFAEKAKINHFGTGAAFHIATMNAGVDLTGFKIPLRTIGSTGSPLPPATFEWIYKQFPDVQLISLSGGTDVCSAFVSGCPYLPVYAGEIQCRTLGSAIAAYDEKGNAVIDELGELVIEQPMPSMPVYFWGDTDNERYKNSYFDKFENVWCHGDWIKITARGSVIIYGRSDATLNRGGVRIGTAEVYNAVETVLAVKDSLVISIDNEDGSSKMSLYVVMQSREALTEEIKKEITTALRSQYSPRHVPDEIIEVPDIPYTISGKKMEIPVKKLVQGISLKKAVSLDVVRNPEALDFWNTD